MLAFPGECRTCSLATVLAHVCAALCTYVRYLNPTHVCICTLHVFICICVFCLFFGVFCFFSKANAEGNSFGVISFRFSVKMPCVVVRWESA